ncbi:hypothetical protein [uncultured Nostoc sp.]|uniref:hypothetical protein n=1 Tax=uncultured Nostoc sp. TaxID=340711 RepID=UPI0035CBC08D
MSRRKRTSRILEKAELGSSGLKSIVPSIKFDDDNNIEKLIASIEQLRTKLDSYNTALSVIDSSQAEIEEMEKNLSTLSEKMLMVVAIKYGKNSREYEMGGGVRNSERIRKISSSRLKARAAQVSDENAKTT